MLAETPSERMRLHLCLRAPDGIIWIDTCPSKEIFDGFVAGTMNDLRRCHGLPEPELLDDYLVHTAFVDGRIRA